MFPSENNPQIVGLKFTPDFWSNFNLCTVFVSSLVNSVCILVRLGLLHQTLFLLFLPQHMWYSKQVYRTVERQLFRGPVIQLFLVLMPSFSLKCISWRIEIVQTVHINSNSPSWCLKLILNLKLRNMFN